MLNYIHGTLPNKENEFGFAFSGGVDSVVFTNYLLKQVGNLNYTFFIMVMKMTIAHQHLLSNMLKKTTQKL